MTKPHSNLDLARTRLAAALATVLAASSPDGAAVAATALKPIVSTGNPLARFVAQSNRAHASLSHAAATAATTSVVTSCADDGGFDTLRHAVVTANDGDTIDLSGLPCSQITLQSGALQVGVYNLTIRGPGSGALKIDANQGSRVITHDNTGLLTVDGLTIANGKNVASLSYGGCIYSKGSVTLHGTVVTGCTAAGQAGAAGGGIFVAYDLDLEGSTLTASAADAAVGAAMSAIVLGGGAVAVKSLTLNHSTLSGNTAHAALGRVYGGGLASSSLTVKYSTISANSASSSGGGNDVGIGGGIWDSSMTTIINSTIDHNQADIAGGLLINGVGGQTAAIVLTTISSNIGTLGIGAIETESTLAIYNSTIAFNTSGSGLGVAVAFASSTGTVDSSIIADNSPFDLDGGGMIGGANNIIKLHGPNVTVPVGTIAIDPDLGPLQFNGGSTRTHALSAFSIAIDQGDNTGKYTFDQRGPLYPRVVGAKADIGAVEYDADHIFGNTFDTVLF